MLDIPYMDHLATLHKFPIDFDRLFFDGKAVISGFDFRQAHHGGGKTRGWGEYFEIAGHSSSIASGNVTY